MRLSEIQRDRVGGVLLASAAGDALGVPYEFGTRALAPDEEPQPVGGGLGDIAPGQWSDDTEMATCISQVAATGADLRTPQALDQVAAAFLQWYADEPPDVGNQTRAVLAPLRGAATDGLAARMTASASNLHERTGLTAGNGSLMRTGAVALAHLGDTEAIIDAARSVSALTHTDSTAGDACALWCLAIDHAVRTGELDVRVGLPHVSGAWADLLDAAESGHPSSFPHNGWVVSALQAAWSAIHSTGSLRAALIAAVRAGNDTDTVAAIAGQLAGALYGASAVPLEWQRGLHGWPALTGADLVSLATRIVHGD